MYHTSPTQNPYATGIDPYHAQANAGGSSEPPKKYIKVDGVTQINPEYTKYQAQQGKPATTALSPQAMPVVSNMEDHAQLNQVSKDAGYGSVPLAAATDATIQMMQESDICQAVGVSADEMVDGLGAIFSKYEAPMGLMNKLMCLSEYDCLEFIVDDSGSMGCETDTLVNGHAITRWQEAHDRIKSMLEVMAWVPTQRIVINFLNRSTVIDLKRHGERPQDFINDANQKLDQAFSKAPGGSTPVLKCLQKSFSTGNGKRVARYFFGDGVPDGGDTGKREIEKAVRLRQDPQGNPMTFLSCTNEDTEVEWMKELEETAPFCAEYDDFLDEANEIRRDQGDVLPFTRGFHLIGQLVAAMNPDDLDAMDESVPLTKYTLDNLLGVKSTDQEYRRYFDGIKAAQQRRAIESPVDRIKKEMNWEPLYKDFMTAPLSKTIPAVQDFKRRMEACPKQ